MAHGVEPIQIYKTVRDLTDRVKAVADTKVSYGEATDGGEKHISLHDLPKAEAHRLLIDLEKQMKQAAKDLEFEKAAMLRDQVFELRQHLNDVDDTTPEWEKVRRMGDAAAKDELLLEAEMAPDVPADPVQYKTVVKRASGRGKKRR